MKRTFDREFKLNLVRQLMSGEKRLSQICREHNRHENVVRRWKAQYDHEGESAWSEPVGVPVMSDTAHQAQARIAQLEAALGRAHLEIEFLRFALEKKGSASGRNGP